jgi:hypothetical protein
VVLDHLAAALLERETLEGEMLEQLLAESVQPSSGVR